MKDPFFLKRSSKISEEDATLKKASVFKKKHSMFIACGEMFLKRFIQLLYDCFL